MIEILHYIDSAKKDRFNEGLERIKDKKAQVAIIRRLMRIELSNNFGDCKYLRDGVSELRIDVGKGYRVYYAHEGKEIVLLLCCGTKRTQNDDIDTACGYLQEWENIDDKEKERRNESEKT